MEINTIFEWNGKQFPFDLEDADDAERLEKVLADVNEKAAEVIEGESDAARIRRECGVLRAVFDGILEEGAAEAMFGKKNNLRVMYEAFDAFLGFAFAQRQAAEEIRNERFQRMARFSPARAAQNEPKLRVWKK